MKKVCLFCETWEAGGIESFLSNVLSHADFSRMDIQLCVCYSEDNLYDELLAKNHISVWKPEKGYPHSALRRTLFTLPSLIRLFQKQKYDVVHLNIYHGLSLVYACAAKLAGVPRVIAHSHNNGLRKSRGRPLKLLAHTAGKYLFSGRADLYWACSKSAAEFMFPHKYAQKAGIIPNGIDLSRFIFDSDARDRTRQSLKLEDKFVVGHVGRFCYQKNQSFLLDVLKELLKKRPNAVLLLVGDGEDRERLLEKAAALSVKDHVIFYGVTGDVPALLWTMDVFSFPSLFEGLGIAVIEAQAAGLPVLCSSRIPKEAAVTDAVRFLPASAGAREWAEELARMQDAPREDRTKELRAAGYDIKNVAETIKNTYLEGK